MKRRYPRGALRAGSAIIGAIALLDLPSPLSAADQKRDAPTIEETRVTADARQLNVGAAGHVTLNSVLPVPARETIVLKDMKGAIVRTLVDERRTAGTYADRWDGKGDGGKQLKDDQYRWIATFHDESGSFTIDRSAELDGDFELKSHPEYPPWDPYRGVPLKVNHTFDRPGEIVLVFSRETYNVTPRCDPPAFFCRFLEAYRPAGEFMYEWAGVDDSGTFRDDLHAIFVISHHEELAKNAIVVYGGRPSIVQLRASPAHYRPDRGVQEMSFRLGSYPNAPASVVLSWMNEESRSVLRTIKLSGVRSGPVKVQWDGRSDSGVLVAPGAYLISARVTDTLGQEEKAEILSMVMY